MLLCRLRVEVGSTRLRLGGDVGISVFRVRVGVCVFVPFEVVCPCAAYTFKA